MMIDLGKVEPNEPKANLEDYFWLIMGVPKGGKTSLLYKLAKERYNDDLSKLLLFGFEKGYTALRGIHAVDVETFKDFQEAVSQLISEKDDLPYRLIALDTVDIMWSLAEQHVVRRQSLADKKRYKTIGDIPYGQGWAMVKDAVQEEIIKLSKAGFGLFAICHVKEKKFETRAGVTYDKYTTTLSNKGQELFVGMADFVLFLDVTKEKEDDTLVDKRYIYFRSDGTIEAGSRFANVPEKIEYDITEFLDTFEQAILSEYDGDKDALNKASKKHDEKKKKDQEEFIKEEVEENRVDEIIEEINQLVSDMDKEKQTKFKNEMNNTVGAFKYKTFKDVDKLEQSLEIAKNI